jgi:hypothetical protein
MLHTLAACQVAKLNTERVTENNTSGGSNGTELNELTVILEAGHRARER